MKLTFTMEIGDYLYLNNFVAFGRRWKQIIAGVGIITFFVLLVSSISSHASHKDFVLDNVMIFFILIFPMYLIFLAFTIRFRVNKLQQLSPEMFGETILEIVSDGISVDSKSSQGTIKWEGFFEFIETKKYFLLFNTPISALVIPKRVFTSEKGINELSELLKKKSTEVSKKYSYY